MREKSSKYDYGQICAAFHTTKQNWSGRLKKQKETSGKSKSLIHSTEFWRDILKILGLHNVYIDEVRDYFFEQYDSDAGDIYEVENIIGKRAKGGGKTEYLVKWRGFKESESTWELESNIFDKSLIASYNKKEKKARIEKRKIKEKEEEDRIEREREISQRRKSLSQEREERKRKRDQRKKEREEKRRESLSQSKHSEEDSSQIVPQSPLFSDILVGPTLKPDTKEKSKRSVTSDIVPEQKDREEKEKTMDQGKENMNMEVSKDEEKKKKEEEEGEDEKEEDDSSKVVTSKTILATKKRGKRRKKRGRYSDPSTLGTSVSSSIIDDSESFEHFSGNLTKKKASVRPPQSRVIVLASITEHRIRMIIQDKVVNVSVSKNWIEQLSIEFIHFDREELLVDCYSVDGYFSDQIIEKKSIVTLFLDDIKSIIPLKIISYMENELKAIHSNN
ncbi:hypothetical protein ADUPG1_008172 [Aduncisulcus paluster]|uniref:Chromo domain-containing protein n=1 Tax=Aduncisulcus paluster TaxID=2918883 RepID=A0ABQ5KR11_9EUKA|nr:hypothetical protein ADUPG1_008172 [Aduncisulcus paluster]|eukprot:gnl/Carplike_NY0171/1590_a2149_533.p1 GENE.gnl/Carplike_NY0171/1590_a2149_533~~gnl/Carplike_NY0171/1590_a2149_533.p1  ORF type:complete len:447 (+),score=107.28 gnl/Carplike_NY0171/1590_a2149_533:45-1385(+)